MIQHTMINKERLETSEDVLDRGPEPDLNQGILIHSGSQGQVDLVTDIETLAIYLRRHSEWIKRCFKPLKVYPLSDETYKLQFFRMGGLGFELEPCFGVQIWDEPGYLFRLSSIELPSDRDLTYKVTCQSYFQLDDQEASAASPVTRVHWKLQLQIWMELPSFIQVLPAKLVYRVASQVVHRVTRSMSDRLTHNVCADFYRSMGQPQQKYHLIHEE